MAKVKSFKLDDRRAPDFSDDYEVIDQVVLNLTNIGSNNNKFYVMELQECDGDYRVFTHYGRVGVTGTKEGRYFLEEEQENTKESAEKEFKRILKSKQKKGYVPVEMEQADVGSGKAEAKPAKKSKSRKKAVNLDTKVQNLVEQIYTEASKTLASTIRTPLGALSESQIDKGAEKLDQIRRAIRGNNRRRLTELSSQYYSLIPQRFPHRIDPSEVRIDTSHKADRQEELLQLMRDVYNVKDELDSGIMAKYKVINAKIKPLESKSDDYERIKDKVARSHSRYHNFRLNVNNIYTLELLSTKGRFNPKKLKTKELFHGSANKNILGILQRGLLIAPPCADFTGAAFGRGIYFASHSTKSAQYSTKFYRNKFDNGFLFLADVALGKIQPVKRYTFRDNLPARGYDSVHGVQGFDLIHEEFIVYNVNQVELCYLIDYKPR